MSPTTDVRALALAAVSAAAFGLSGPFAKALLDAGWSPSAAVLARVGGAAASPAKDDRQEPPAQAGPQRQSRSCEPCHSNLRPRNSAPFSAMISFAAFRCTRRTQASYRRAASCSLGSG